MPIPAAAAAVCATIDNNFMAAAWPMNHHNGVEAQ